MAKITDIIILFFNIFNLVIYKFKKNNIDILINNDNYKSNNLIYYKIIRTN